MNDLATQEMPTCTATTRFALRVEGDAGHVPLELSGEKTTIGSGQSCTIRLTDQGIRPLHCLITSCDDTLTIRRWSDGTLLNGQQFTESSFSLGDRLTVGPVELVLADLNESDAQQDVAEEYTAEHGTDCHSGEDQTDSAQNDDPSNIPWEMETAHESNPPQCQDGNEPVAATSVEVERVLSQVAAQGRTRARSLLKELRWARAENLKISEEVRDLNAQLQLVVEQRDGFTQERQALESRLAEAENQLAEVRQEVEKLRSAHEGAIVEANAEASTRIAQLSAQIADRDALVTDLQLELARRQEEQVALNEVMEAAAISKELRQPTDTGENAADEPQVDPPDATDEAPHTPEPSWDTEESVAQSWTETNPFTEVLDEQEARNTTDDDDWSVSSAPATMPEETSEGAEEESVADSSDVDYPSQGTNQADDGWNEAGTASHANDDEQQNSPASGDLWGTAEVDTEEPPARSCGFEASDVEGGLAPAETEQSPEPVADVWAVADSSSEGTIAEPSPTPQTQTADHHDWSNPAESNPAESNPAENNLAENTAEPGDAWDIETSPAAGNLPEASSFPSLDSATKASPTEAESDFAAESEFGETGEEAFSSAVSSETAEEADLWSDADQGGFTPNEQSRAGELDSFTHSESDANIANEPETPSEEYPPTPNAEASPIGSTPSDTLESHSGFDVPAPSANKEDLWSPSQPAEANGEMLGEEESNISTSQGVAEQEDDTALDGAPHAGATTLFDKPASQANNEGDDEPNQPAGTTSFIEQYKHLLDEDAQVEQEERIVPATHVAVDEPVQSDESSDDDCKEYMEQMMARLRGDSGTAASAAPVAEEADQSEPEVMEPAKPKVEVAPLTSLEELKTGVKPEESTDMSALRDLANTSAREAIKIANSKQARETALANLAFSVVAGGIGGFMAWDADGVIGIQLIGGAIAVAGAGYWACRTISALTGSKPKKRKAPEQSSTEIALPISGVVEG